MDWDNKTFLIIGLVIGGLASVYVKDTNLASVIFGGLIGYLAKDPYVVTREDTSEDGSEIA